jgi:WD40 repeat protein
MGSKERSGVADAPGDRGVAVWSAVFSPDGRHIATTGEEPFVRVWDLARGRLALVVRVRAGGRGGVAPGIAWSPDGSRLAVAPFGGTTFGSPYPLKVWNVDSGRSLYTSEYEAEE